MHTKTHIVLICLLLCAVPLCAQESPAEHTQQAQSSKWLIVPGAFYTPETSLGLGGGVFYFLDCCSLSQGDRQSYLGVNAIYTFKDQVQFAFIPKLYLTDRWLLRGKATARDFPAEFYGIGNNTAETGETYTQQAYAFSLTVLRRVASNLYAGVTADYQHHDTRDVQPGGLLEQELALTDANQLGGLGLVVEYDSRDSEFFPRRGSYHQLTAYRFFSGMGDAAFTQYQVDARRYLSPAQDHILALQLYLAATNGDVPYFRLPMLGGANLLRGIYKGRFRDKALAALQVEYRRKLWRKLYLVVFAGTGLVAPEISDFRFNGLKYSMGAGLRYRVAGQGVNLRLDFGYGEGDGQVYFGVMEAF